MKYTLSFALATVAAQAGGVYTDVAADATEGYKSPCPTPAPEVVAAGGNTVGYTEPEVVADAGTEYTPAPEVVADAGTGYEVTPEPTDEVLNLNAEPGYDVPTPCPSEVVDDVMAQDLYEGKPPCDTPAPSVAELDIDVLEADVDDINNDLVEDYETTEFQSSASSASIALASIMLPIVAYFL